MKFEIHALEGPAAGKTFPLVENQPFLIGRGDKSDTRISDPYMSRIHCNLVWSGDEVALSNEGSGSTIVGDTAVSLFQLRHGDEFQAGESIFRLVDAESQTAETTMRGFRPKRTGDGNSEKAASIRDLVGQSFSHYRLDSILSTGSTGIVFKGTDTENDRPVAVKVLFPERTSNDDEKERFIRAMKTMLPIKHPNLIRIYNAGKKGPFCWVAMEFIEGENLTQVIDRIGIEGMLDWKDVWKVGYDVASALQAAFENKVVHRNVTPVNIIRRKSDKTCFLGDLMLAKALEGSLAVNVTLAGEIVGNLAYLPPESTGGNVPIDSRLDIYGLGATLYALLTGRPPFCADTTIDLIRQIREKTPEPPHKYQLSIQGQFEGIVMKMLEKRPEDRYQDPQRLLTDLVRVGKFNGLLK